MLRVATTAARFIVQCRCTISQKMGEKEVCLFNKNHFHFQTQSDRICVIYFLPFILSLCVCVFSNALWNLCHFYRQHYPNRKKSRKSTFSIFSVIESLSPFQARACFEKLLFSNILLILMALSLRVETLFSCLANTHRQRLRLWQASGWSSKEKVYRNREWTDVWWGEFIDCVKLKSFPADKQFGLGYEATWFLPRINFQLEELSQGIKSSNKTFKLRENEFSTLAVIVSILRLYCWDKQRFEKTP